MLNGRPRYGKSKLEAEHSWDGRGFASLEVKVLGEEFIYGLEII